MLYNIIIHTDFYKDTSSISIIDVLMSKITDFECRYLIKSLLIMMIFLISLAVLIPSVYSAHDATHDSNRVYSLSELVDGDLVKTKHHPDVYIIKILSNGAKYKRLILNPEIFNSYGHLEWENIKIVTNETLNQFQTSNLVREVHPDGSHVNGRIYMVFPGGDQGTKSHVDLNYNDFIRSGGDPRAVYDINYKEASDEFYPSGSSIRTPTHFRSVMSTPQRVPEQTAFLSDPTPQTPPPTPVASPLDDNTEPALRDDSVPPVPKSASNQPPLISLSSNTGGDTGINEGDIEASIQFHARTIAKPVFLANTEKPVLMFDITSDNKDITVKSVKVSLSPLVGTDNNLENTFTQAMLLEGGSTIATKNIFSSSDYTYNLNSSEITFDNVSINIPRGSTRTISVNLKTKLTLTNHEYKDWNVVIHERSISSIDESNNRYYNGDSITGSLSVRETIITHETRSSVRNFRVSAVDLTSITLNWDEFADAQGYEVERCSGVGCTDFGDQLTSSSLSGTISSLTAGTHYRFRIRAQKEDNSYTPWRTINQYTLLTIPTGFSI